MLLVVLGSQDLQPLFHITAETYTDSGSSGRAAERPARGSVPWAALYVGTPTRLTAPITGFEK